MAVHNIVLGPYFASGYITDDYVIDGSLQAILGLSTSATQLQLGSATLNCSATVSTTASATKPASATLASQTTLSAQGQRLRTASATLDAVASQTVSAVATRSASKTFTAYVTLSATADGITHGALATLSSSFTETATAAIFCLAEASLVANCDLTGIGRDLDLAEAALSATATLTCSTAVARPASAALSSQATLTTAGRTTVFHEASAAMASAFTQTATAKRIVDVIEAYQPPEYIWDNVTSWALWPDNIWGKNGVTLRSQISDTINGGLLRSADASMSSTTTITTTPLKLIELPKTFAVTASTSTVGGYRHYAASSLSTQFAQTTLAGRLRGITETLSATFTQTATARRIFDQQTQLNSVFSMVNNQTGATGVYGVKRGGIGSLTTQFTLPTYATQIHRPVVPTFQAFTAEVVVFTIRPQDVWRTLTVSQEIRTIDVLAEVRTIDVAEETRTIKEPIPPRYANTNRRPIV